MRELADQDADLRTPDVAARRGQALLFRERGEPLKVQLIEEKTEGQSEVSCYTIKDKETFVDFCVGPHVPVHGEAEGVQAAQHVERCTGRVTRAISRCSACTARRSCPRRSSRNICTRIEEAKKRDHRKLGRDQKLFMFHQWAPGATFWLPKGTVLYNTLANYMRDVLVPSGYTEVKARG